MGTELPYKSYAWRLEASVWAARSGFEDEQIRCRPRLFLVNNDGHYDNLNTFRIMGFVEYDPGGKYDGRANWLVYYYPLDSKGIRELHDEKWYGDRKVLDHGELRYPRDSANAAVKYLLELVKMETPHDIHTALSKVSESYINVLIDLTNMYIRRLQQTSRKQPQSA